MASSVKIIKALKTLRKEFNLSTQDIQSLLGKDTISINDIESFENGISANNNHFLFVFYLKLFSFIASQRYKLKESLDDPNHESRQDNEFSPSIRSLESIFINPFIKY